MSKVRHEIQRRRVLRDRNYLLSRYGFRGLTFGIFYCCFYMAHRRLYPPEYETEEEQASKLLFLVTVFSE
jgi:hypothetical protein